MRLRLGLDLYRDKELDSSDQHTASLIFLVGNGKG